LVLADLEQQPTFSALSYVWGTTADEPYTIICDDIVLPITKNCHSPLVHLRRKAGAITIWIDAICINQRTTGRKNSRYRSWGISILVPTRSMLAWRRRRVYR
ncbi:uncharacterized protein BDZ99DRAFT_374168, partial [Mytilinidion resinicola]